jgi:hypothetical protein
MRNPRPQTRERAHTKIATAVTREAWHEVAAVEGVLRMMAAAFLESATAMSGVCVSLDCAPGPWHLTYPYGPGNSRHSLARPAGHRKGREA